jgi:hypothetical protein
MSSYDVWTYRSAADIGYDPAAGRDLTGYSVEALDGSIGKIDEENNDVSRSYLIVDTGPWIFGKKVMLPAGVVQRIDDAEECVWVNRTKDQIKDAPEFDETRYADEPYREELGSYYGQGGRGYRDWADAGLTPPY